MLKEIPPARLLLYVLIIGLVPVIFALMDFLGESDNVEETRNSILFTTNLAREQADKQSINLAVRQHFDEADPYYIDKNLESLQFLQPEIESLERLVNNRNFTGDEKVQRRLDFLAGSDNRMLFVESNVQSLPYFQETATSLIHPVEVNQKDLQKVLALVEGRKIGPFEPVPGRPQLIILDFKLDKKEPNPNNEVYLLNLKLLKREFSQQ